MLNLFFFYFSFTGFFRSLLGVEFYTFFFFFWVKHGTRSVYIACESKPEWREGNVSQYRHLCASLLLIWNFDALQLKLKLSSIAIKSVASSFCVVYTRQMLYNYYFLMYVDDVLKLNIAINQHKNLWKYAAARVVLDQLCCSFCVHELLIACACTFSIFRAKNARTSQWSSWLSINSSLP